MGWPPYLLQASRINGNNRLVVHPRAATTERQWKSFLSWMLGVAGARHALHLERYRWIAPVSAFYKNAIQTVDLSAWNPSFPQSLLKGFKPARSRVRLFPDYLALRRRSGAFDWAVAEAKGTPFNLSQKQTCPTAWSRQARNISLTLSNMPLTIHRNLVVATRVNPNGVDSIARCIQVRAWNRETEAPPNPEGAAVELVAAHLFGLLTGLGLRASARSISSGVLARAAREERSNQFWSKNDAIQLSELAHQETERMLRPTTEAETEYKLANPIETSTGEVRATLASALVRIIKAFFHTDDSERLAAAVTDADKELDRWEAVTLANSAGSQTLTTLPCGVVLAFPPEFEREMNLEVKG
jgi:hypothetical protein